MNHIQEGELGDWVPGAEAIYGFINDEDEDEILNFKYADDDEKVLIHEEENFLAG